MKKFILVFAFFAFTLVAFGQSNTDTIVLLCIKQVPPKQETINPRCCSCIMREIALHQREITRRIILVPLYLTKMGNVALNHKKFRFDHRVNQMANMHAGVLSMDGSAPSILGGRTDGTAYYINEVKVLEGFLPQSIE